ncbi:hypothetical protein CR194_03850 [Salipaludibacillus keqinensis]|uniref:HipA-like kinase domain-containing protein n=1 Tax=Salipaludibacillus keqinensis TaxID=2045207 RepID=A0A323TL64_9BACI|nr:HipA family kinase [Salipaludibacillus keqinensis]PYZ94674.1 hypothetical protein CR194_03850 [Salipaludibacillus keqinensis]
MQEQDIYPIKHIAALRGDNAHIIECSDGKKYVVKFGNKKKKREKELVNEYVVGQLASHLSLPVPPSKLVFISSDFIEKNSTRKTLHAGLQFATLYIEDSIGFPPEGEGPLFEQILNKEEELAGIMIFDQWVNNTDRGRNNILFENRQHGDYVYMIDHGRCFPGGYGWNCKTLKNSPQYRLKMPVYKWILSMLESEEALYLFAERMKAVPHEKILNIVDGIPAEWTITTDEKEALIEFLIKEKENSREVVDLILNHYRKLIGSKRL